MTDAGEVKTRGHVLVVDDLHLNRRLCLRILRACGFTADEVTNGAEALEAVKQRRYDAVLLDREMPVIDGLTAARLIRQLDEPMSRVPIIAISASDGPDDVQQFLDAGMDDYLTAPIKLNELQDKLALWVKGRSERDPPSGE